MSSPSPNASSVAAAKEKDGQEKEVSGDETFDQYGATASGRKRLFSKELGCMMFGFGEDQNRKSTQKVSTSWTDMTHQAMETGRTGRVQVEDVVFMVRKDQRKFARGDLLTMNEQLKKARKAFDEVKYADVT